ncbi:hypothetical protein HMPREF2955_05660 [Prevotella sp. HMSC073D09]|uniref:hypothetical protein n=1 Tax=Prevotella sp. HMSC073D09 TaxID=1739459 RepID=UPI0008A34214|nr:hypothetical protein [Prevotella sp. HMSC073D09]OFQ25729.1 hypothetical protein HMPREF2955_05660 [Prevotella sp. HMSC073D09]
MLHTIKNLSLCAMFAIVVMAFAACSSDDDRDNPVVQQLIGSWQQINNCNSCEQSNTYETWYKDLTWDKHAIVDGNAELVRKGDFGCKDNTLHLRSTCPKGRDLVEMDFKVEINGDVLTLTNLKTKDTIKYKRRK